MRHLLLEGEGEDGEGEEGEEEKEEVVEAHRFYSESDDSE